jgi:hypothetical protein
MRAMSAGGRLQVRQFPVKVSFLRGGPLFLMRAMSAGGWLQVQQFSVKVREALSF